MRRRWRAATGLCAGDARPARARRRGEALSDRSGSSVRLTVLRGSVFPPPIVQLAAIASRPPLRASLRDGFASLDPPPTRKDSAPAGRAGKSSDWEAGR
jgi:hypothetical protein